MINLKKEIFLLTIIFSVSAINNKRNAIAERMNVNIDSIQYVQDGVERTLNFSQTYNRVVPSIPKIAIVSIDQLQVSIPDQVVQFMFSTQKCLETQIQVAVTSSRVGKIQKLALRYLILFDQDNQTWIAAPNVVYGSGTEHPMQNISTSNSYNNTTIAQVNMTGGIETFYFISGLNISSNSDNFDIQLNVTHINSNTTLIQINSVSQNQTWVNSLCYCWLTYNKDMVTQKIGRFNVVPTVGATLTQTNLKVPLDMITGFYSLKVMDSNQISITVTVDTTKIDVQQLDTLTNAKIKGFITKTYDCQQKMYFQKDDKCYTSCPLKTYEKETDGTCNSCSYDCLTCQNLTSAFCVSCNGTDNRVLEIQVGQVGRCVPMDGFFQNIQKEIEPCSSQCRTCEGVSDNCTSCHRGMEFDEEGQCVPSKGFTPKVVVSISAVALIAVVAVILYRKFLRNDRRIKNEGEQEKDEKSQNEKDDIIIAEDNSRKELRMGSNKSETALSQIIKRCQKSGAESEDKISTIFESSQQNIFEQKGNERRMGQNQSETALSKIKRCQKSGAESEEKISSIFESSQQNLFEQKE